MGVTDKVRAMNPATKRISLAIVLIVLILIIVVVTIIATRDNTKVVYDQSEWENPRLSGAIRPIHYNATITIDVEAEQFSGYEEIELSIPEDKAVTMITLHAAESLTVTNVHLITIDKDGKKKDLEVLKVITWSPNSYVIVQLKKELWFAEGTKYFLTLEWSGKLEYKLSGLYLSAYEEGGVKKTLVSSQMQADDARKAIPCFDEPAFKAKFDVRVVAAKKYKYVAWNTKSTDPDGECPDYEHKAGWKICSFKTSPIMSPYLLGFVVADYACTKQSAKGAGGKDILHRVCGTPTDIKNGLGDFALDTSIQFLAYYEKFYGISYPLTKVDHVAVPAFQAGAMENWGIVIYRTASLMFDKNQDETSSKFRINLVVGHELAHMWFGNLVTMKWWSDVWLNEGFATYAQGVGSAQTTLLSAVNPDPDAQELSPRYPDYLFEAEQVKAMGRDAYTTSRPASVNVTDLSQIHTLFDRIAYQKGASLLQQLNMVMGSDGDNTQSGQTLTSGIGKYLAKYQFSNAEQSELWAVLDEVYTSDTEGITVESVMNTWTLQMNFPVVMVTKVTDSSLIFVQKRFVFMDGEKDETVSPFGYQWYVPVKGKTLTVDGDGLDPTVDNTDLQWIKPYSNLQMEYTGKEAIFINWEARGFFLTSYSLDLWNSLITNLDKMELKSREIQVLLHDTSLLVQAGYYPISRQVDLLDKVLNIGATDTTGEYNYNVMLMIYGQLRTIRSLVTDDALKTKWEKKWETQMEKYIAEKFEGLDQELYTNTLTMILARKICLNIYPTAKVTADSTACKTVIAGEDESAPDYMAAVYTAKIQAADEGGTGEEMWEEVWEKYHTGTDSVKNTLAPVLASTSDTDIVKRYIGYTRDEKFISKSDGIYVLSRSIAPYHLDLVVDDMVANLEEILEYFGELGMGLGTYVQEVLSQISEQTMLNKVVKKFAEKPIDSKIKSSYETGVQKAKSNIARASSVTEELKKVLV